MDTGLVQVIMSCQLAAHIFNFYCPRGAVV